VSRSNIWAEATGIPYCDLTGFDGRIPEEAWRSFLETMNSATGQTGLQHMPQIVNMANRKERMAAFQNWTEAYPATSLGSYMADYAQVGADGGLLNELKFLFQQQTKSIPLPMDIGSQGSRRKIVKYVSYSGIVGACLMLGALMIGGNLLPINFAGSAEDTKMKLSKTTEQSPPLAEDVSAAPFSATLVSEDISLGDSRDALSLGVQGPIIVMIPSGRFVMGSPADEPGHTPDEGPQTEHIISTPFYVSKYEITVVDTMPQGSPKPRSIQ